MQKYCRGKYGCGKLLDISEFATKKYTQKSGLVESFRSRCKVCERKRDRERHALLYTDPEYRKKKLAKKRAYRHRKKLGIKLPRPPRQTYEERKAKLRKYQRKRRQNDPNYRIRCSLRSQMWGFLKGKIKKSRMRKLVGISAEEFRQHIEAQFLEGMTWDNYGQWHIDHIVPCESFDLTDAEKQRECFHYTNVQALWGQENESKGSTITPYIAQRKWTGEEWVNTLAPWLGLTPST